MSKKIILRVVFLFMLMTICQTAFAQFKVDDLINQLDNTSQQILMAMNQDNSYDRIANDIQNAAHGLINQSISVQRQIESSNQRRFRVDSEPRREQRVFVHNGNAYARLSQDDKSLYSEFQIAYQQNQDFTALRTFNGRYSTQVARVANAIVADN